MTDSKKFATHTCKYMHDFDAHKIVLCVGRVVDIISNYSSLTETVIGGEVFQHVFPKNLCNAIQGSQRGAEMRDNFLSAIRYQIQCV